MLRVLSLQECVETAITTAGAIYGSSAVVFHNAIYNFGGWPSSHSVVCCSLCLDASLDWKFMDLPNTNFKDYFATKTFTVGNKIVYFGSQNQEAPSFWGKKKREKSSK